MSRVQFGVKLFLECHKRYERIKVLCKYNYHLFLQQQEVEFVPILIFLLTFFINEISTGGTSIPCCIVVSRLLPLKQSRLLPAAASIYVADE
jgi:hypothetical protein